MPRTVCASSSGAFSYKTPRIDDAVALVVAQAAVQQLPPDDQAHRAQRLEALRDRALLLTLYATGMRRAEIASLSRIDIQDGRSPEGLITGKGDKERIVFFDENAMAAIRAYLEARGDPYLPYSCATTMAAASLDRAASTGGFLPPRSGR